jgi:predicted MFS family arabinose efflux permease
MSFAVLLTITAVTMVGPFLIDIATALDTTMTIAGEMITVAAATWAVTAMLVVPFSDACGRKPVLLLSTVLLAFGSLGIGLAPIFPVALASGVLISMGGGMVPPTCIAVLGAMCPGRHAGQASLRPRDDDEVSWHGTRRDARGAR